MFLGIVEVNQDNPVIRAGVCSNPLPIHISLISLSVDTSWRAKCLAVASIRAREQFGVARVFVLDLDRRNDVGPHTSHQMD
jgi:hypothetical protein